jgi:hypothetical protein
MIYWAIYLIFLLVPILFVALIVDWLVCDIRSSIRQETGDSSKLTDPAVAASTTLIPYLVRGRVLVRDSLILAIFIEVLPTEADLVAVLLSQMSIGLFVLGKAICLAIILLPLSIYIGLNGWKGPSAVKGKFAAICIIVGLNLVGNVWYLASRFFP